MAHRPRWTLSQVTELFEKPLLDLLFEAQQVHRSISILVRCRSALCCRLRPELVRKIANTARKARATKPGWKPSG